MKSPFLSPAVSVSHIPFYVLLQNGCFDGWRCRSDHWIHLRLLDHHQVKTPLTNALRDVSSHLLEWIDTAQDHEVFYLRSPNTCSAAQQHSGSSSLLDPCASSPPFTSPPLLTSPPPCNSGHPQRLSRATTSAGSADAASFPSTRSPFEA